MPTSWVGPAAVSALHAGILNPNYVVHPASVVVNLIAATTTSTGLKVQSALDRNPYPPGRSVSDAEMDALYLRAHAFHGEWNYSLLPRQRLLSTDQVIS